MNRFNTRIFIALSLFACAVMLSACEQSGGADAEQPVLRIHDVSGLRIETLDDKLNKLLIREDLPLRGKVELLDDNRLAVNASRYLQDEIAAMIGQLRNHAPADAIQRPFRVEFWLLRMAKGSGSEDVPGYLSEDLEPLLAAYEGYRLSVYDYLESFHSDIASVDHIASGKHTNVYFERVAASADEIVMDARVASRAPNGPGSIQYDIDHALQPGKALVLGRAHDGGGAKDASYQVLVARAEWTDSTD